jgi:radical SAM-linked protein
MRNYCLTISKKGKAKFISHLDLYRTLERALRRSFLPISFTEGYNPHPKVSFLTALELGATSDCEKAIITLKEPLPSPQIKERLNRFLPDGIRVEDVSQLNKKEIIADSTLFILTINLPTDVKREDVEEAIKKFLEAPGFLIKRERKEKIKDINLRDFVRDLKLRDFQASKATLELLVSLTPSGSAKPREVIEALQSFLPQIKLVQVHRENLYIKEK